MWPFDPVPDSGKAATNTAEPVPAALAWVIATIGRSLIVAGLLLLAFAGFQLWGTGIAEARAQEKLAAEFEAVLEAGGPETTDKTALSIHRDRTARRTSPQPLPISADPSTQPAPELVQVLEVQTAPATEPKPKAELQPQTDFRPAPDAGDPVGRIVIPAIDVDKTIVEGTARDVLRSGPGHYATTPLPGQSGNASIAGHRTTHGAPFFDIDKLEPGDEITVETVDGTFSYLVEGQPDESGELLGHRIVDPSDVSVIADKGDDRLTLTACHPKYSAEQRIIVTATLVTPDEPAESVELAQPQIEVEPQLEPQPQRRLATRLRQPAEHLNPSPASLSTRAPQADSLGRPLDESLGWQSDYAPATFGWAAFTAAIAAVAQVLGRFWRRVPAYAIAVPPFGLALYYCFVNLEHFIPAV